MGKTIAVLKNRAFVGSEVSVHGVNILFAGY